MLRALAVAIILLFGIIFAWADGLFGVSFIGITLTNVLTSGTISPTAATRLKLSDQGSCTMSAGACTAQSLASTYTVAPICMATVITAAGTTATPLRAPSTTSTVTPQTNGASDTSVVGWMCVGN